MKRVLLLLGIAASFAFRPAVCIAQDAAARASAIADRDAAEERNKQLNSTIESLWAAKAEQDRRLSALSDEIRSLRAELSKADSSKYVTREEFRTLAEKLQEVDNKRMADRKLIEDKFAELKTELRKLMAAPAPSTTKKSKSSPAADATGEKSGAEKSSTENSSGDASSGKPQDPQSATQKGVWYKVESGNTLAAIVAAHNEEFKKQSQKTSVKLVLDANPGLKPTSLKVGSNIFIPVVPQ